MTTLGLAPTTAKATRHRGARANLAEGNAARDRREWGAAAGFYQLYLQARPDHFAIWVQLGHAVKESGDLVGALTAYSEALRLNAKDADLLLSLGHLHKVMGHGEEAVRFYRLSAELDGNAHALYELERLDPATARSMVPTDFQHPARTGAPSRNRIKAVRRWLVNSLNSKAISALKQADTARDLREWNNAAACYKVYLRYRPNDFAIWVQLGHALKESGHLEEALGAYNRAFSLDSNDTDLLLHLGHLHKRLSKSHSDNAASLLQTHVAFEKRDSGERHRRAAGSARGATLTLAASGERLASAASGVHQPGPPLFDGEWYRSRHRDSLGSRSPLAHYLEHGLEPGFDPNPYFDNGWYAGRHALTRGSALEHYINVGEADGAAPHPLWDEAAYLHFNKDIGKLLRDGAIPSGYRHFVQYGARELETGELRYFKFKWGRHELDYDRAIYLADNPDVAIAIGQGRVRSGIEHLFTDGFRESLDGLRAIYGPRHLVRIRRDLPGTAPGGGKHLCFFAHFDRDSLIDVYVVSYLKALRKQGVDIVFITATADDAQLDKIRPLVRRILVKNDAGRDFGSWWLALTTLGFDCGQGYSRVIFANDSIYCPVRPIEPIFADMEIKAYDLYGLSDSREEYGLTEGSDYHLQSFFLAFGAAAQEVIFPQFVAGFASAYALSKMGQIQEFEYGITRMAQQAGLSVGAYLSVDDVREELIHNPAFSRWAPLVRMGLNRVNPAHELWNVAISRFGWPAVKVELLRDNPREISDLSTLDDLITDGEVLASEIHAHQQRILKPATIIPRFASSISSAVRVELKQHISGKASPANPRLVLFAHYDPHGIIDDHILHQIKSLVAADCSVAFITPTDATAELAKVMPYVTDILIKNSVGRDFGSWSIAIETLKSKIDNYDSVIWMNDSTYFPMFDPRPMFNSMDRKADFWGVVDSNNVTWHIMSWFWSFNRKIVNEGWFDWYLREHNANYTKWAQIHNYEMRIPRLLRAAGFRADAYITSEQVAEFIKSGETTHTKLHVAQSGAFSMTHDFWEETITQFRCPALKVELVRDNPLAIDLSRLMQTIGEQTSYDPELIRRHMLRLKTRHLPPPTLSELGYRSE